MIFGYLSAKGAEKTAAKEKAAKAMVPGDHGSTYGGNPLATAAINVVFEQ